MNTVDRRGALKLAGLAGLAATLPACGRGFGGGGDQKGDAVELNMVWWGDAARAEKTQKALDLFHTANPGIRVRTEYQDSSPYKDKLVTRFAAGDPPDLMAMRTDSLREYANRGALLDLAQQGGKLDLSGLTDSARGLGVVGRQNFGVPSGLNAIGFVVDKALTDKFGVQIPDGDTWSWEDLATFAKQVTTASGGKVYGTNFEVWTIANLIVWTRQHGEDFYTADGKLGITAATMTGWLAMVQKMRADKAFPPAGFIDPNGGASAAQSYIAKKAIASQIIPTNNFLTFDKVCGGQLQLLRIPGETQGARRGQSIDTPALWSVAAKSKHPAETLTLLNFLVNDVAGAKAAGTTRGVPASRPVATAITPGLETDDQRASAYLAELQNEKLPPSYSYPIGASKLTNILKSISTEVEFGRKTPAAGAAEFVDAGQKALSA
ncbi:ABC transporter substrate-binding protein [Paractinoplanes toevensis]|uniref:Sugar ABC transporter substrate-binding protein n=1 Tax=Paractinoplanes toevensis TaxID=571911 RepID=A0A919VYY3_9ACTN|nr:extracellular solute-binding protein [Actinoplanes toevensis]GIM89552.1 sugar ABC transporter substrate-binding protein [Actinoplanes toevensis]